MLAKLIVVAVIGVGAFLALYKPMYRVVAPFSFAPNERRFINAPFEGYIKEVYVHPGDPVKAKQTVLFELDSTELKKEYTRALGEANTADKAYQKYMGDANKKNQDGQSNVALARIELEKAKTARAEAELYQYRIERAKVMAGIDGEVLEGELRDKKGMAVKPDNQLMIIGKLTDLRGELRVPEQNIQDVKSAFEKPDGGRGTLAVSSIPAEKYGFHITRIFPTTEAKEGSNYYKVWVEMDQANASWLPGMEGEARVDVRKEPLIWIWTHRLTDFMRLKLWSWGII